MDGKTKHDSTSDLQTVVIVNSPRLTENESKGKKSYDADNLAFEHEELITRSTSDVYHPLSVSSLKSQKESTLIFPTLLLKPTTAEKWWLFKRAVISGCLLTLSIVMFYLWIHVRYIDPMLTEITKPNPVSIPITSHSSRAVFMPKINKNSKTNKINKSTWLVDYDLPAGVPILKLNAKDITGESSQFICPLQKFALALHVESDSHKAENWLKTCGHNIAYFRLEGSPSPDDIYTLTPYLHNANYLPLKGALNIEKGESLLENEDFRKTRKSDEVIRNVVISGYATPQTMDQLVEAVPYAEELTIKGDAICSSLKRSRQNSKEGCQKLSWQILQKLHIVETGSCLGMFDLIYSCWEMPIIDTLQVRKSNINDPNANFIRGILDKYRITNVDFADNVCFGNTILDYPFMCQPSN